MMSSNGNIFRVTGPLCGEFTGPGECPTQRPVTRSFDVFFDLRLNKRLSKQPWGWWFETPSWSLWRQCNVKSKLRFFFKKILLNGMQSRCHLCPEKNELPIGHVNVYMHVRQSFRLWGTSSESLIKLKCILRKCICIKLSPAPWYGKGNLK